MRTRLSVCLVAALAPATAGCAVAAYQPRPSPRIQVIPDGTSLVLVKNGRAYSSSVLGSGLEEAVQGDPRATEEARAYHSQGVAGFVLGIVGSVSAGAGAAVIVGNQVQPAPTTGLDVAGISLMVGGLVLSIVSGAVTNSAQPHLWNAINIYNDGLPVYPAYPAYPYGAPAGYPAQPAPAGAGYPGYPAAPGYPPGYAPPVAPAPVPVAPVPAPVAPVPAPTAPVPAPTAPAPAPR